MIKAIIVILVLGALILAHEFGHFIMGRLAGVRVLEFSFGMGPRLGGVRKNGTEYTLRALPFGGYVRFLSREEMAARRAEAEEAAAEAEDGAAGYEAPGWAEEEAEEYPESECMESKGFWQKVSIYVAGPFMNLFLGALIFILAYAIFGVTAPSDENVVGAVVQDMPAQTAGLEPGDRVVAVNGAPTADWEAMTREIRAGNQGELILSVEKTDGRTELLTLTPVLDESGSHLIIGVTSQITQKKVSVSQAVHYGLLRTWEFTKLLLQYIVDMFAGREKVDLGGPVAIAGIISEGAEAGATTLLPIMAILSLQFGVLNLLPIPALDGGQLTVLIFERIRGRELSPEKKGIIQLTGFALLLALMIAVTYSDILRLFGN
ncbi:MAG: RIP metalloprotease RseP [Gracilibacteraceae bacterium]|jgi:regulator of sigma E protease|nr:RIP metalloprotease RseP [Gracilibacteraceae bacterium]